MSCFVSLHVSGLKLVCMACASVSVQGTHLVKQAVVMILFVHLQCYRLSGKNMQGEH